MAIDPKRKFNPPKPLSWKSKHLGCCHYVSWAYKRNYKAEIEDIDGDLFRYTIYEISDKENPQLVLWVEASKFPYEPSDRCCELICSFAKGRLPALNKLEKDLIAKDDGAYYPERMKFIQYRLD